MLNALRANRERSSWDKKRIVISAALLLLLLLECAAAGVELYDIAHAATVGFGDAIELAEIFAGGCIAFFLRS